MCFSVECCYQVKPLHLNIRGFGIFPDKVQNFMDWDVLLLKLFHNAENESTEKLTF